MGFGNVRVFKPDTPFAEGLRRGAYTGDWALKLDADCMCALGRAVTVINEMAWQSDLQADLAQSRALAAFWPSGPGALRSLVGTCLRAQVHNGFVGGILDPFAYFEIKHDPGSQWIIHLSNHDLHGFLSDVGVLARHCPVAESEARSHTDRLLVLFSDVAGEPYRYERRRGRVRLH